MFADALAIIPNQKDPKCTLKMVDGDNIYTNATIDNRYISNSIFKGQVSVSTLHSPLVLSYSLTQVELAYLYLGGLHISRTSSGPPRHSVEVSQASSIFLRSSEGFFLVELRPSDSQVHLQDIS